MAGGWRFPTSVIRRLQSARSFPRTADVSSVSARDTLVALGASLLAAGLLARLGRRIGLPTIPLFMIAGLLFGPNTPGIQLVDHPERLRAARRRSG